MIYVAPTIQFLPGIKGVLIRNLPKNATKKCRLISFFTRNKGGKTHPNMSKKNPPFIQGAEV